MIAGIYMLLPTLIGESAADQLRAQAQEASAASTGGSADSTDPDEEVEEGFLLSILPEARLSLGLDLQGGIDMTLEVKTDEAVNSSVKRDIAPLRTSAEDQGLLLGDVRRQRGEPALMIEVTPEVSLGELTGFMDNRYSNYAYENTQTHDGKEYYTFRVTDEHYTYTSTRAVEQALETLRNRIDETGVKEPAIVLKGGNRINIQLPGIDDPKTAINAIGTAAVLEFLLVDEEAMEQAGDIERALLDAERELAPEVFLDDVLLTDHLLDLGIIPDKTILMWEYVVDPDSGEKVRSPERYFVLKDEVILTGDDINDASTSVNQYNEPYTALEFKPRGANIFSDITGENVGRRFAIVLDKKVTSAPVIRERIGGGRASIESGTGDYQQALQDAQILALVLRTGALPAPVEIGEIRTVGASLGADAVASGKRATAVGFSFVLFFMVLIYRSAGMVSVVALLCNVLLVFSLLASFGATLTLPGIAGIALTIGMAVDCNIIIYERIREELRLGKNARYAVGTGFNNAFRAVLDANITTFIAGVVLYTYGTGPIKGFAVTLMIGIMTTLFTGIFLSRTLMDWMTRNNSARLSI